MTWMIFTIACFVCAGVGLVFWIGGLLFAKSLENDNIYFGDEFLQAIEKMDEETFDLWSANTRFRGQLNSQRIRQYVI